jgi:hypothetical protein
MKGVILLAIISIGFMSGILAQTNARYAVAGGYIYPNSEEDFLLGKNICYYALADSSGEIVEQEVIREEDYITQKIMIDNKNLKIIQDSINRYYLYAEKAFKINRILIDSLSGDFFNFDNLELSWDLGTDIYKKDKYVLMRRLVRLSQSISLYAVR